MAVLAMLSENEMSGIDILNRLPDFPNIGIAEGSIYPLLNRLETEGRIVGTWVASSTGTRNSKVYKLTKNGRDALKHMRLFWADFEQDLSRLLESKADAKR